MATIQMEETDGFVVVTDTWNADGIDDVMSGTMHASTRRVFVGETAVAAGKYDWEVLQHLTTADSVSLPTTAPIGAGFSAEDRACVSELGGDGDAADSPFRVFRVLPFDGEGHSALARATVEAPRHAATLAYAAIVAGLSAWSMACG